MSVERRYALIGHTHDTGTGGGTWGTITGTLSDQTDLWTVLQSHTHDASAIVSGTINSDRLPAVFTADAGGQDNITNRVTSGFYETSTGTQAEGWPDDGGGWQHLLAVTHSNNDNYYSMQFAASFFNQEVYHRNVNNTGSRAWNRIWTSASFDPNTKSDTTHTHSSLTASAGTSLQFYQSGAMRLVSGDDGKWQFNIPTHANNANLLSIEIQGPQGSQNEELSLRFHQASRWWQQIRVRNTGFYFTTGYDQNMSNVYALGVALGDQSGYPYITKVPSGDTVRLHTAHGYGDIGPANSSWFHFSTDRGQFYFGNPVYVNGGLYDYGTSLAYSRSDHGHGNYFPQTPPDTTIAPAGGVNGAIAGWSALDGYGGPVPNYGGSDWWVGVFTGGSAARGLQIAGGYADTRLFYRKGGGTWGAWYEVANLSETQTFTGVKINSAGRVPFNSETYTWDGEAVAHYGMSWFNQASTGGQRVMLAGYDALEFHTQGQQRAVIDSNGNAYFNRHVLIGTSYAYYFDGGSSVFMRYSQGSYGSVDAGGSKGGYAGIRFSGASSSPYLMWGTGSAHGGIYSESSGWWLIMNSSYRWFQTLSQYAIPWCTWSDYSNGKGAQFSRGTANPSGGSDGDVYYQYA